MPVKFKSEVSLDALNNATVDTDKILVSDNGIVKYRTGTEIRSDIGAGVGSVTSVGLTMPVAFSVANSPITSAGNLEVTAIGTASQYIRGDGQLATLPAGGGGGGSSVFYYLNGSVAASVATYKQMDNTPVIGGGTDFNLVGNGLIAQFLTDIGNPNRIQIPGGAWNFEMFFNMSSVGGNTKFYVELLKYNGTTFTSIASNITVPEEITGGTSVDLYLTSIAVPETVLLTTDRLAIRVYIVNNSGGRTATLHTEDNTLCQVTTTFSAGVTSINGLTENTQYLAVGTAGSDFNISSLLDTHTFNLPTASSTKRGALSIGDWTAFNNKANASGTINYISKFTGASSLGNSIVYDDGTKVGIGTISPMYKLDVNGDISLSIGSYYKVGGTNLVNDSQYIPKATTLGYFINSLIYDSGTNIGIGTTAPTQQLTTTGDAIIRNAYIGYIPAFGVNYASFSHASRNNANDYSLLSENNGTTYLNASLVQSIKFRIGNFDKAIIDSNGNFGIGTTIPTAKLEVVGNINITNNFVAYPEMNISGANGGFINLKTNGNLRGFLYGNDGGLSLGAEGARNIDFYTNGSQKAIITSAGNVGIGNTDTFGFKTLINSGNSSNNLILLSTTSGVNLTFNDLNTGVGSQIVGVANDLYISTNNSERMRITSAGNVGIGTTSPTYKLSILGPVLGTAISWTDAANNTGYLSIRGAAAAIGADNNLVFETAASERMRITSAGNVGIGTTSPGTKLTVNGNFSSQLSDANDIRLIIAPTTSLIQIAATYNTTGSFQPLGFFTSDVERMRITSAGNVGIGTTSPLTALSVSGNLSLFTTNQIRLYNSAKNNWAEISSPLLGGDTEVDFKLVTKSGIVYVDPSGNVGIGTTSPTAKLHVVGMVEYATNALAIAGGLTVGAFYHTAGVVKVVI